MKKQAYNPYLPQWEYIPDGEPHVFNNRLYIFGSHDRFNGHGYCLEDYVCWSAPLDDLSDWKQEGIIYQKTDDPLNKNGKMSMFAPDVCQGVDGRYYLYYVLSESSVMSVAVCDEPAGKYCFYGYVQHSDGTLYGHRVGDDPQFDPAVLCENGKTYLYSGSCPVNTERKGSAIVVLASDMLTICEEARTVVPSTACSEGTGFKGHEFFEASSIRSINGRYYFVYSSVLFHELCYAVSDSPTGNFTFMGTIISAGDIGIDSYKPKDMPIAPCDNNHGGLECINGQWYIFYHRHTNRHGFSRQGCAEPIEIEDNGCIRQARVSSYGLNGRPFENKGMYPAYIACHLFRICNGIPADNAPYLTMNSSSEQYITNIRDGAVIGFRSFAFDSVSRITVTASNLSEEAKLEVALTYDGDPVGVIDLAVSNDWGLSSTQVEIPNGVYDLYFRFVGGWVASLLRFSIE